MKKIAVVICMCISGIVLAQQGTVSPYSFYGIGTLKFKGTAENRTMAGISTFSDSIHLNIQNPAGVAALQLVNYTVGASYKFTALRTATEKARATTSSLDYLAIGLPLGKFGASFGLIPYTAVGYKLQTGSGSTVSQYTGSGGLNKAFLSVGYAFSPKLRIGAEVNYNFGNIENQNVTFTEGVQFGTSELNRSDLLGFSYNFGAQYETNINDKLKLHASATYTPETRFTSENFRSIATILDTGTGGELVVDLREENLPNTDFTFPSQYTLGVGIGTPKKWFAAAEYTNQKTSNYTNSTFLIDNVTFTDATKIRLGGFFIPNYNAVGSYLKRTVYRAGFRFEEMGLNIGGQGITEFGISFGVGLPVGRVFSNTNIGFEIGRRGTKEFGLVQEHFFNTFISLSLNDKWFQKRYID